MAEELIKRYWCDGPIAGAAVVRFVYQLPGAGSMVADLCLECWEPVGRVLTHAADQGGARKLRDVKIRSEFLTGDESMTGAPTRPALTATVVSSGRWVLGSNSGMSLHARVSHWLPADASTSRCGFVNLGTIDFDNAPLSMNKQCGKCVQAIEADARRMGAAALDAPALAPAPAPVAKAAKATKVTRSAAASPPALFSNAPVTLDGGKPGRAPAGALLAAANALPFDEWPRHESWEWVDHKTHAIKERDAYWKAHARPITGARPSLCSRIPGEAIIKDALANGEHAMCSLCFSSANKIIRLERQGAGFNG